MDYCSASMNDLNDIRSYGKQDNSEHEFARAHGTPYVDAREGITDTAQIRMQECYDAWMMRKLAEGS